MQTELFPVEIKFTDRFKKDVKHLYKKYRSLQKDVDQFIELLKNHEHPGDRLDEIGSYAVYKARIKNSDNNRGQSGGYRICYVMIDPSELKPSNIIILLTIYSKSDQIDIEANTVRFLLKEYFSDQSEADNSQD